MRTFIDTDAIRDVGLISGKFNLCLHLAVGMCHDMLLLAEDFGVCSHPVKSWHSVVEAAGIRGQLLRADYEPDVMITTSEVRVTGENRSTASTSSVDKGDNDAHAKTGDAGRPANTDSFKAE